MDQTSSDKLATKLNEGGFTPETDEGAVTLVTEEDQSERPATEEELADLGFARGYVDAHPEGADRGGWVPFVHGQNGAVVTWSEGSCQWEPAY